MSRKGKLRLFGGLFLVVFLIQIIGQSYHHHLLMFRESAVATGSVLKALPENHAAVYYRFTVGEKVYEGADSSAHYEVGDQVKILYVSSVPSRSSLRENVPSAVSMVGFAIIGALFISALATVIISISRSPEILPLITDH